MSQSWQRFHEWMKCVAVVTFDLELGQKMEYCFPNGVELSEQERSDVGYLSLPDTHSTTEPELESRFYFRILLKDTKESDLKVLKVHKKLRDEAEHYLEPESKHLIGIAYFRQGKNSPNPSWFMTPPSSLFKVQSRRSKGMEVDGPWSRT